MTPYKARVTRKGNHPLVVGAVVKVEHVDTDGVARVTVLDHAVCHVPLDCLERLADGKENRANACLAEAAHLLERARMQVVFALQLAEEVQPGSHAQAILATFEQRISAVAREVGRPIAAGAFKEKTR